MFFEVRWKRNETNCDVYKKIAGSFIYDFVLDINGV